MVFDPLTTGAVFVLAAAEIDRCAMAPKTQINIRPHAAQTKVITDKSMLEMQKAQMDTIDPYGFHGTSVTQGYMKGGISLDQSVKVNYKRLPGSSSVCLWYESINVDIKIDPEIHLAKEVAMDGCMKNAVYNHELKHVNVDRQIVNKYAKEIGRKVYDTLKVKGFKVGPVPAEHAQNTIYRMQDAVKQVVAFQSEKMQVERREKQQEVDNIEEYTSVNAQCPNFDTSSAMKRERYLSR